LRKIFFVLITISLLPLSVYPQSPDIIFSDDFQSYQNGSNGTPNWIISKGFWQIKNGKFIQKTKEYDCGTMLEIFINYSFELSYDFRVRDGEPGAGFFFHSEDFHSTEFSHMSRFESNKTMLIGHFMQGGYECTHSARFDKQKFSNWHRLTLQVDQDKKQYSIYLDNKPISEGEPILFPAGYCGLQSSGGVIEFDNVTLRRLPMKNEPVTMNWLHHFLVTDKHELIVPHKAKGIVQRLDLQGKLKSAFGLPIKQKGQLDEPTSITQLSNGKFIVGDEGLHRIHLFDKKGNWKNSVGYFGTGSEQLNSPADISVDENDNIFVVDQGNNRIQVWDKNFKFVTEFGNKELDHPAAVAVQNENIFVLNNGMNQVEVYSWSDKKAKWQADFGFGSGVGRDILIRDNRIYISVGNEIRLFDNQGELMKKFTGESIKGIYPYGLEMDRDEQIYAADFRTGHIVVLDPELAAPEPLVNFPTNTQAEISFSTHREVKSEIRVIRKDQIVFESSGKKDFEHCFQIENLTPSTTYHIQFSPSVRMIPTADGFSKKYAFITPAEPGKKHYWSLPMVTIIFTNVIDTAKWKSSFPELPALPEDELKRIQSQVDDGIRFYWMNSGMNLFIDNEYIVVHRKLLHHEIFGTQWWYPPKEKWVIRAIEKAGKKVEDYVAVLYLVCVRDYNEENGNYELRGRGGGFTAGIGANSQYGLSYWEVTHANHGSGNNWLMTHEFHHQLDELFLVSGYPEYWFNHFSPTVNTAADFGEHFDGNAWILKNWHVAKWYDLKFGEIRFTTDEDMDGIPDDDPSLPIDEVRLHSSPKSIDSDGDGVSDLDEIKFSNWTIEGCGETYGGTAQLSNLINSDTDGDQLEDSEDAYPLCPFQPTINFGNFVLKDSAGETDYGKPFARLIDNRVHASVFAKWNSSNLNFIFKIDRLAPVKLMVDADADGWFIGRDNYLVYLRPKDERELETELVMVNCADPKRWPFHDVELAKKINIRSEIEIIDDEYFIRVSIPRDEYTGVNLELGEKLGVNIGFSVIMDAEGHQRYVTIFEPNRFFDVELVE